MGKDLMPLPEELQKQIALGERLFCQKDCIKVRAPLQWGGKENFEECLAENAGQCNQQNLIVREALVRVSLAGEKP